MLRTTFTAVALLAAQTASADISLTFIEGAPKDRFVLASTDATCANTPLNITLDLAGSTGKLVFDTTASGAGVEVFQPFDLVSGQSQVIGATPLKDGDQRLTLALTGLAPGQDIAFTIDVDDTIAAREITVTDSEIQGASLAVTRNGSTIQSLFGTDATARLPSACS